MSVRLFWGEFRFFLFLLFVFFCRNWAVRERKVAGNMQCADDGCEKQADEEQIVRKEEERNAGLSIRSRLVIHARRRLDRKDEMPKPD